MHAGRLCAAHTSLMAHQPHHFTVASSVTAAGIASDATGAVPITAAAVRHYENFPVASLLCPARLRAPIRAIYAFARTADDLADEGTGSAQQRLQWLHDYRCALHDCARGQQPAPVTRAARGELLPDGVQDWSQVFGPLSAAIAAHGLPVALFDDLLDAFVQDVQDTRDWRLYPDRPALLDYCRRSANPIGRLMLHLYGVDDAQSLAQSDALCTALQLINFWQDLSEDLPRGRCYLPLADCVRHGLHPHEVMALAPHAKALHADHGEGTAARDGVRSGAAPHTAALAALLADLHDWAAQCMAEGAPLALRLPGRMGWELRLVVQGGLRVLEKVRALGPLGLHQRPTLRGSSDGPWLLWRAWRMGH